LNSKINFNMRGFTSLLITALAIVEIISSIILYIAPAIMRYTTHIGLTRNEWKNIHIIVGFLFIFAIFFHLIYNWKILTNYIKKKGSIGIHLKWETISVLIITVFIFVGSYKEIPPLSYISDYGYTHKISRTKSKKNESSPNANISYS